MKALEGITVLSLEQAVAAPYASSRLAEAGARVIKVEREEGDFARGYDDFVKGMSAYFVWLNAGKQSITLNLKEAGDAELMHSILATADVFIQNLAPGAVARLGFDPAQLLKTYPSLIVCSISGYGEQGPYRDQKAYDLLIQAETGLCSITGVQGELTRVGVSASDISAGMTAYEAILEALFARERDPEKTGSVINVSLFHATADWMNVPYLQHEYGGFTPQNQGLQHPSIAPYGVFICGDDKRILISIQNEREWQIFCAKVLGDPAFALESAYNNNTNRLRNRTALDKIITTKFKQHSRDGVVEMLSTANIAYGRVSDLNDLAKHPQNRYRDVNTPNGIVKLLGRGAETEGKVNEVLDVPSLGQDNEKIREEFGKKTGD